MNFSKVDYRGDTFFLYYPNGVSEPVIKTAEGGRIWEKKLVSIYSNIIKEGDTVLDCGAYIGSHSAIFSKLVGQSGKTISIEPQPKIVECLKKTIERNKFNNIELIPKCVGCSEDKVIFSTTLNGRASMTHLRPRLHNKVDMSLDVFSIDSLKLSRCDFIKIDVEGSEFMVLKGAVGTIAKFRPTMIFETWARMSNRENLESWCDENNYTIEKLMCDNYLLKSI
jgi:FkbM family methyltransferase